MKKIFLYFLVACVTSVGISQIANSATAYHNNTEKIEATVNQDNQIITKLNEEYASRSDELNNKIKENLIDSITLVDNQITINYQNLNRELYSEAIYQAILSTEYLDNLTMQFELNLISFDVNNHINFNEKNISNYNTDIWGEWRWYWFAWWKLHLSHIAITTIIQTVYKFGGTSGAGSVAASRQIAGLLSTGIAMASAIIVAGFIILSFAVILVYSTNAKGCWIGMVSLLPGFGWGSN